MNVSIRSNLYSSKQFSKSLEARTLLFSRNNVLTGERYCKFVSMYSGGGGGELYQLNIQYTMTTNK